MSLEPIFFMKRTTIFKAFFLSVFACAVSASFAQDAKPAKPAEYTSVAEFAGDETILRDFKIQGEYSAKIGDTDFGVNVIALGKGEFRIVVFVGGLPGDGWKRGDTRIFCKAKWNDDGNLDAVIEEIDDANGRRKADKGPDGAEQKVTAKVSEGKLTALFPGPDGQTTENTATKVERKSPTEGEQAPEGAVLLFVDGRKGDLLENGKLNEEAKTLWAEASTKPFEKKPYTLHVEFMLSYMPEARGQGRSNSGVYIDECYECQVLDSFGLEGRNNECGGFYTVAEPKVNMCFPPLRWQTYDIDFVPAVFDAEGGKVSKAKIKVRHNGVVIHEGIEPEKETHGRKKEGPETRGLYLQGHGNKVQYRNLWLKYD